MRNILCAVVLVLLSLSSTDPAARADTPPGTARQAGGCEARCRQDYQGDDEALRACLRECGAIGPATPQGARSGHEATHVVQQAGGKGSAPISESGFNLNSSKSNVNRAAPGPGSPTAVEGESGTSPDPATEESERAVQEGDG